jgi:dTDP-4-amino-4,6-dideoxygalactose transaminase
MSSIPFFDLSRQQLQLKTELDVAIARVMDGARFIGGKAVTSFEQAFARALGVPHVVGTGNGTDALYLILTALACKSGDEIIVPAWGCFATAEAVSRAGLTPVFCDVDPGTFVGGAKEMAPLIGPKTKGVIAVHLYGQAAPVKELKALCDAHGLFLIEDCAQAHFSKEGSAYTGTTGIASAFSFYPTKNLGALGDAGAVITRDEALAQTIRSLANHGSLVKDEHQRTGINSRLDALQAAVLSVKLAHVHSWNERRRAVASAYLSTLSDMAEIHFPVIRHDTTHTFHQFCIRVADRPSFQHFLSGKGIATSIHYPYVIPHTPAYQAISNPALFPVSSDLSKTLVSLPIFPELLDSEVTAICTAIRQYFSRS